MRSAAEQSLDLVERGANSRRRRLHPALREHDDVVCSHPDQTPPEDGLDRLSNRNQQLARRSSLIDVDGGHQNMVAFGGCPTGCAEALDQVTV